jgi:hypothetical protein
VSGFGGAVVKNLVMGASRVRPGRRWGQLLTTGHVDRTRVAESAIVGGAKAVGSERPAAQCEALMNRLHDPNYKKCCLTTPQKTGQPRPRGVNAGHPKLPEAVEGRAEPLGGHSDPALHNGGNPHSEFTAWSTDPGIVYGPAMEYGPEGVVLRIPAEGANIVPSLQDIYGESEVLITSSPSPILLDSW